MKTHALLIGSTVALAITLGCASSDDTPRTAAAKNAAAGAAAGAALGGVVGHQSGETGEGAAIGAVVGGALGAASGARRDRDTSDREIGRDSAVSYNDSYYMSLLTPDEVATLQARARASGRARYELTEFLTSEEKENLRRRDASNRQIGRR